MCARLAYLKYALWAEKVAAGAQIEISRHRVERVVFYSLSLFRSLTLSW